MLLGSSYIVQLVEYLPKTCLQPTVQTPTLHKLAWLCMPPIPGLRDEGKSIRNSKSPLATYGSLR